MKNALESKGFRIGKIESMKYNFSIIRNKDKCRVKIKNHEISKSGYFWYLGSMVHKEGSIKDNVIHRVKAGYIKWRSAIEIFHDHKIPAKLKKKFYNRTINLTMLYNMKG